MFCQNFLEANQKSFSMASLNSSHTRVLAFGKTNAAALLAIWLDASAVTWDNKAQKASFFSLMAYLTAGNHQQSELKISWKGGLH